MSLQGGKELSKKLKKLGAKLGITALGKATRKSATPTTTKIRAKAPVGKHPHKTYKGRPVFPGFLKRSIRSRTRKSRRRGAAITSIGVLAEAYYGLQFLDRGTKYIPAKRWFTRTFVSDRSGIETRLIGGLKKEVEKG